MKNELIGFCFGDTPYNAWLIKGNKNILIDGVPKRYSTEYIKCVKNHIELDKIDAIVFNHAAPEHTGCLPALLSLAPNITVYSTIAGLRLLDEQFDCKFKSEICKCGGGIDDTLKFFICPNIPWPDTMMTYALGLNALFTGLLFSTEGHAPLEQFYAENLRFFAPFVSVAVDKAAQSGTKLLYPLIGHSPIENSRLAIQTYSELSKPPEKERLSVLVAYATNSGYTADMAKHIVKSLESNTLDTEIFDLSVCTDIKKIAKAAESADALILGTYTENRNMPKCVWEFLSHLDTRLMSSKPYFVFGSKGWSGEGIAMADEILSMLKLRRSGKPLCFTMSPNENDYKCADKSAAALLQMTEEQLCRNSL